MKRYIKSAETELPDKKEIRELRESLADFYEDTRDQGGTPKDTVDLLIDAYGIEAAKYIVAVLVNAKGRFDRRISDRVFDWAESIAPDEETLRKNEIYYTDRIHPAHMNQIAEEIIKR